MVTETKWIALELELINVEQQVHFGPCSFSWRSTKFNKNAREELAA